MKHVKLITLLLAAGLTACSSDDGTETPPAPRRITVEVTENPFIDSETGSRISLSPLRRIAAYTTTESLKAFKMSYDGGEPITFDKNNSPNTWYAQWPQSLEDEDKVDFYAYTGGYLDYNSGNPRLTFTLAEDAFNQHDLLVAEHKQIAYSDDGGHVSLTFDHACAAVFFNVQITNTLRTELKQDLSVHSIILRNVVKQGDYDYKKKSWAPNPTLTTYYTLTTTTSVTNVGTKSQSLPCGYMFLIPQEGLYLEVNYTLPKYGYRQINIHLPNDLAPGVLDVFNIRLGLELLTEGTEITTSTQ